MLADLRRVVKDENFLPQKYQDIMREIFVTAFLGSAYSSKETHDRAKRVAEGIGSLHLDLNIDEAY